MAKTIARNSHQSRAEVGKRVGSKRSHLVTKSRSNPFHTSGNSPTGENVSPPSSAPTPDFLVDNHGSIFLIRPVTVPNLIRELRQARLLSRPQLARQAKVSRSHLWAIETGKIVPGISTLEKLSEALGVGLSRFLMKSDTELLLENSFVRSIQGLLPNLNFKHRHLILMTLQAAPQKRNAKK
jgi:transcriptional regulator with XRE-family HTH domain